MASVKPEISVPPIQKFGNIVLTLDNVLLPPEKLNPSPSSVDGLDSETEYDLRVLGCELIQTSGILLRLPQVAMACGQVLFQRMYYAKSLVRYPMEATAMACVALASKIEEAPRKIRDVINVFKHIRQVRNGKTLSPVVLDGNYIILKNQVIKAERRLLKELGFCCHVKHPHKMIIIYLRLVEADENRNLAKSSWNYMNDALRTDVFMRYSPESIACSCIWLAARQLRVPLPENPPWYHIVSVNLEDIQVIAASILKLYTRPKIKLEALETRVEEIRKQQQEARLRNKLLPPQQTPVQPTTSTFSPASRNQSPRTAQGGKVHHQSSSGAPVVVGKRKHDRRRSGSDTSRSSGSRQSRSEASPSRGGGHNKKLRRSDSRDGSRSRSRSNDRHHSRGRSRDRSRERHHSRKSASKSSSPNVTPPPRFIKNKEKGPIVQSVSRSRSRSPPRTYDKYERQDKYSKYERRDKHQQEKYAGEKYQDRADKYVAQEKYEAQDKYAAGYDKNEKYAPEKYDKNDRYEKIEKHDRSDKYSDKYGYEKSRNVDKYEKSDGYVKEDKYLREEKSNSVSKYPVDGKEKGNKYDKVEKYDKIDKYDKVDKYSKYEKAEKKKSQDSKKLYDNGYDKYEKVHKNKKANRHRSRSRDRRR